MSVQNVSLGDIAAFIRGVTYKPTDLVENFSADSLVCMRTANIQAQLDQSDLKSIPSHLVKAAEKRLIAGDILVSTANSWNLVGKCCWVPELAYDAVPGGFIAALRADPEKVVPRYLYHWFNSPKTQIQARNCGRQTTNISNMDLNRCLALTLPLPSLQEQRRIATILDKADALRAKRRDAIAKLDQLLQSVFVDMFGDPVSNPQQWPTATLETLSDPLDRINYGVVQPGTDIDEGIPLVRVGDIEGGFLSFYSLKHIDPEIESAFTRSRLKGNELLISCVGSIGVIAEAPETAVGYNIARAITRVPLTNPERRPFVREMLRTQGVQNYFHKQTRTVSQPTLNVAFVKTTPVISPPDCLQLEFVSRAHALEKQKQRLLQVAKQQEELFSSLQQRAFSGQS